MEAKKLNMKIPPSALYCPVCNEKIDKGINTVQEVSNILKITKCCEECGAK